MNLTILFDMDDTLLINNIDIFLPVYIQSLSSSANQVPQKTFISALLGASEEMVRKSRVKGTLESTFDQHFYPLIGFSKLEMRDTIDSFYQTKYSSLKKVTTPLPDAQNIVNKLLSDGHLIVIATNPLFPQTAISQRLDWAGFEQTREYFKIITSFEHFHFSKPHPEYYAEILAQLGWPDQPAVMIGNSFKDDIQPSEMAGLYAFFLSDDATHPDVIFSNPLSTRGALQDILPWLNKLSHESTAFLPFSQSSMKIALSVTPAAVDTLLKFTAPEFLQQALNAVRNAIIFDHQISNLPAPDENNGGDSQSLCAGFFESRELLLNLLSDSAVNFNQEDLFMRDRSLLRSLISLRS